jgi:hypothetical protein
VREFIGRYGLDPLDVRAVVGPCIEAACYQVGDEVVEQFPETVKTRYPDGTWRLDLRMANHDQLVEAGLRPEHIHISSHCTRCDDGLFHSYRREGKLRGTMIAFMEVGDAHD